MAKENKNNRYVIVGIRDTGCIPHFLHKGYNFYWNIWGGRLMVYKTKQAAIKKAIKAKMKCGLAFKEISVLAWEVGQDVNDYVRIDI